MKIINDTYKGNLRYIAALAKGHKMTDVMERLKGITCGPKNTSCPDQLAQLLKEISDTSSSDHTDEVL